jgi:hypothetical protein
VYRPAQTAVSTVESEVPEERGEFGGLHRQVRGVVFVAGVDQVTRVNEASRFRNGAAAQAFRPAGAREFIEPCDELRSIFLRDIVQCARRFLLRQIVGIADQKKGNAITREGSGRPSTAWSGRKSDSRSQ